MKGVWGQRPQFLQYLENLKHNISDQRHLKDPNPHLPLKIFFADLHLSQEWSWELEKYLKSDNYLKIFITGLRNIVRLRNYTRFSEHFPKKIN